MNATFCLLWHRAYLYVRFVLPGAPFLWCDRCERIR